MDLQRVERLARILLSLQSRARVPADELARELKVTPRTLYRDIADLRRRGILIEGSPGPEGGYTLAGLSLLDLAVVTNEESLALFLLMTPQQTTTAQVARRVGGIANAVESGLQSTERSQLDRARQRIHFDTKEWYWRDDGSKLLATVRQALLEERISEVLYVNRQGADEPPCNFRPYGLVWKGGFWYVVGRPLDGGDIFRIRLDRVRDWKTRDEHFDYPRDFDLRSWWQRDLAQFGRGPTKVVLRVTGAARSDMRKFSLKDDSLLVEEQDHTLITLFVDRWEWLVPLVLSYVPMVTVLEPVALRDQVSGFLREGLEQHQSDTDGVSTSVLPTDLRQRVNRGRPPK